MARIFVFCSALFIVSCADPQPITAPPPSRQKLEPTAPDPPQKVVVPEVRTPVVKATPPPPPPGEITSVELPRLFDMLVKKSCLLIDVRPGLIHTLGHIPGSLSLPKKSFEAKFAKVKPEIEAALAAGQTVVLYCADVNCPDGYAVGKLLAAKGYSTSIYKGGWDQWKIGME